MWEPTSGCKNSLIVLFIFAGEECLDKSSLLVSTCAGKSCRVVSHGCWATAGSPPEAVLESGGKGGYTSYSYIRSLNFHTLAWVPSTRCHPPTPTPPHPTPNQVFSRRGPRGKEPETPIIFSQSAARTQARAAPLQPVRVGDTIQSWPRCYDVNRSEDKGVTIHSYFRCRVRVT